MKNNCAPGEDNTMAKPIKCGGHLAIIEVRKMITEIWETEHMPESWKTKIISKYDIK